MRRQREGRGLRGRGSKGRGWRAGRGGVRWPRGGREGEPSRALRGGRGIGAGAARSPQPLRGSSAGLGARVPCEVSFSLGCRRAAPPGGGVAFLVIFSTATSFKR